MKIFLTVVIAALIVFCGWVRYISVRPTESHREIIAGLKAELKESRSEFDEVQESLSAATGEIERLNRRLASLQAGEEGGFTEAPRPFPTSARLPKANAPAATPETFDGRLIELKATYDRHLIPLESRRTLIETDLTSLKVRRKSVEETENHFSEQYERVEIDGTVSGKRGVRTSDADRTQARLKIAEKVEEIDREIAGKQFELRKLVAEIEALAESYSKAIVRAKNEYAERAVPPGGG